MSYDPRLNELPPSLHLSTVRTPIPLDLKLSYTNRSIGDITAPRLSTDQNNFSGIFGTKYDEKISKVILLFSCNLAHLSKKMKIDKRFLPPSINLIIFKVYFNQRGKRNS